MNKPQTERLGVAALEYFFAEHGWLFREQTTHDYGIDAHVEIVTDQRPTGKLIAIQIKAGTSFFAEETNNEFIFRADDSHIAYWVGHSMPVVVVLFNPETKQAYWQHVSRETVESTGKGWKLSIPKVSMFEHEERCLEDFAQLTQPEPYVRRLNRLRIDRHWMDLIVDGYEVRVQFDDWINKSLPRYQITIFAEDEKETWPTLYAPGVGIEEMLAHFFPWANVATDWDACDEYQAGKYEHSEPEELIPISENGETATYSLLLSLNELGRSFLEIDDYLADPHATEKIGFTLE
jgi:hypothetical protein